MLRGRPIGLKAKMSAEEMKQHLLRIREEWQKEGYSKDEVDNAIMSKALPLLNGYYWHRFPEACETLRKVMLELGYQVDTASITRNNAAKHEATKKSKEKQKVANLLDQF